MCTLNTTILAEKNSRKFLQICRNIYIVRKNVQKIKYGKILKFYPWQRGNQWKFQSYSTHVYT